jgi:predicted RNase H-like HicB family nuclease
VLVCDNRASQKRSSLSEVSGIATPAPARRFKAVLEWDADDRVWVTYVPALGLQSTYGDTHEEALDNSREAILGYLEAAAKEGISVPPEGDTDVVELEVATS